MMKKKSLMDGRKLLKEYHNVEETMTKKKTVLLIYPKIDFQENYKYSWPPFSLLALSGTLLSSGFNPVIIDQNRLSDTDLYAQIKNSINDTLIVGFSIMTGGGQIKYALEIAEYIRGLNDKIKLVWGGPHVNALPGQTTQHNLVDISVIGQGEITFCELVDSIYKKLPIEKINGLSFKTNSGEPKFTPPRLMTPKNNFPDFPLHLINVSSYIQNDVTINSRTMGFVASQGCPYKCQFCYESLVYNGWWSGLDSARIISSIKNLIESQKINGIKFYDANFFVNQKRISSFCRSLLSEGIELNWAGSAHPNDILRIHRTSPNLFEFIRGTGCTRILVGMESGSDHTLKMIDKQVVLADLRKIVDILSDHQFIGSFTFIVGFPGETDEEVNQTFNFVNYIQSVNKNHETRLHIYAPYPGTPLYQKSIEYGFVPHNKLEDWSDYNYYLPQTPWIKPEIVENVKKLSKLH